MELIVVFVIAFVWLLQPKVEGEVIVQSDYKSEDWRRALREQAVPYGVNPDFADAIGGVETNWQPAINDTGGDAVRGGSYGPTQISKLTARNAGYNGPMDDFNTSPALVGEWTAKILASRPGGPPLTLLDCAAWWNAGRVITGEGEWYSPEKNDKVKNLPSSTLLKYLPRLTANYTYVLTMEGLV